jgi:flagellar biosynthetic protein FlhB
MTLLACTATVFYLMQSPAGFRALLSGMLQRATTADNSALIRHAGTYFLTAAAPVFIAAVLAALAGNFLQGLPIFAPQAATLKWQRLNPVQGLSRLKTQMSWIQWLKMVILVGVVALIVWKTVSASWDQLVTLPAHSLASSNSVIRSLMMRLLAYIIIAIGILAVGDYFVQRWRFEESIKQTKAEVKEDLKATEGNPVVKGKIRTMQREAAGRRMMSRVKDADVIVTDPTHYAVLEYKPDRMPAPRVIAKGRDLIAQKIKTLGREHDIPTVENVPLAGALYRLVDIDHDIPLELYKPVAEVLAHVYKIRKRPD